MPHPHAVVEPVMADAMKCIWFHCPCGWHSSARRPETPGALRAICEEYVAHLEAVGYPYRRPGVYPSSR